jgi:tRNA (adenine57-N1/adenine58-N1)-methyltransferase catalytic subunit
MTFLERRLTMQKGDFVVLYSSPFDMKLVQITDNEFRNRHGNFSMLDCIDKEFGMKLASKDKRGFVYCLYPTPELWTLSLPHRTQILYHADISFVTTMLELRPGMNMIEAGTGSGSFSHSISRTIYPTGTLYSFEYHQERQEKAQEEFDAHGLTNIVSACRDVCKEGFNVEDGVEAIFLDLPSPWEALFSAKKAFKNDRIGRICCFSPCIEQVQRTCVELNSLGFMDIKMVEVLSRGHDVRRVEQFDVPNTADYVKTKGKRVWGNEAGVLTTTIQPRVRGHTSFLTFASLFPQ